MLLLDSAIGECLKGREIRWEHDSVFNGHFIIVPIISRWTHAQVTTIMQFRRFSQDMSGGMPKHLLAYRINCQRRICDQNFRHTPSECVKSSSSSDTDFSNGLSRSQSSPSTCRHYLSIFDLDKLFDAPLRSRCVLPDWTR